MKRLPDTELEVMKALWARNGGAARADLEAALEPHGWAANTINTYLARLTEKGFVRCERQGKSNRYTPLVSQSDYLAFESSAVLNKVFGKSLTRFVAALAQGGGLDDAEVDELQRYLDELKEGRR